MATLLRTRWPFWLGGALLLAVLGLARTGPAGIALVPAAVAVVMLLLSSFTVLRFGIAATVIASILIPLPLAFKLGPVSVSVGRVIGYAVLAGWVASLARQGRPRVFRTGLELPLAGYVLVSLASACVNQSVLGAVPVLEVLRGIAVFVFDFVAFFYVASAVMGESRKVMDYALRGVSLAAILVAALGIVEKITGRNIFVLVTPVLPKGAATYVQSLASAAEQVRGGVARIRSTTEGPNQLGIILVLTLPLVLHYSSVAKTPLRRVLWLAGAVMCVVTGLFTESRSVIIGFALVLFVYGAGTVRSIVALRRAVLVTVALVILFFSIPQVRNTMIVYFKGLSGFQERSANSRVFQASTIGGEVLNEPVLGTGPESNSEQQFLARGATVHITVDDFYLATLGSVGVLGFIALIGFLGGGIALTLIALRRARAPSERSLLAALAAALSGFALLTAFLDSLAFYEPTKLYFLLLAAGVACRRAPRSADAITAPTLVPSLLHLGRLIRRRYPVLLVSLVLGLGLGVALIEALPAHYTAGTIVAVDNPAALDDATSGGYAFSQLRQQMPTYASLATSDQVLSAAAAQLHTSLSPASLRSRVVVDVIPNHLDLDVVATGTTPAEAAALSEAVATALAAYPSAAGGPAGPVLLAGTTLHAAQGPAVVRTSTRASVVLAASTASFLGLGVVTALGADYIGGRGPEGSRPSRRRQRRAETSS